MRQGVVTMVWMALLVAPDVAAAGKLSHYAPAVPGIRDLLLPAPGLYYAQYDAWYTTDTFKDRDGHRRDSITGPLGTTIEIDPEIDVYNFIPGLVWVPELDLLGGHLGMFGLAPVSNPGVQVALEIETEFGRDVESSSWGLGDVYVQPFWLGWSGKHWDAGLAYGFYAPTGRYDGGDDDNVGLGFWGHQIQLAGAWYPFENRGTAVALIPTFETNGNVEDADVKPGERVTVNWGVSQFLPLTNDQRWLLEVGVAGYSQWQVRKDRGDDVSDFSTRDRIHAAGLQLGLIQAKCGSVFTLRWQHEFGARARFQGDWIGLNFAQKF